MVKSDILFSICFRKKHNGTVMPHHHDHDVQHSVIDYLPTYLPIYLNTYLTNYLPTYLPICLYYLVLSVMPHIDDDVGTTLSHGSYILTYIYVSIT